MQTNLSTAGQFSDHYQICKCEDTHSIYEKMQHYSRLRSKISMIPLAVVDLTKKEGLATSATTPEDQLILLVKIVKMF